MSLWASGQEVARVRAITVREESGITTPEEFAEYREIKLFDVELSGANAQLIDGPGGTHILLPKTLTDPAARSWAIAHELGHYEMRHVSPPASELGAPRPARESHPAVRDFEAEADAWAMMFTMPDADVAVYCDQMPMTLDVVTALARRCSVPPSAAARRLTGATIRYCAAVLSQDGKIVWASPSMHLLGFLGSLEGHHLRPGSQIGHGALARRFFDTRKLPCDPALVPAAAWIDSVSDNAWIQEHSMEVGPFGAVLTMLWTHNEPYLARDLRFPPRLMPAARDIYLSDESLRTEHVRETFTCRPCEFAPSWLDVLLLRSLRAAG